MLKKPSLRVPTRSFQNSLWNRRYTPELPRPPPPDSEPIPETFSKPSRPRQYYSRPVQRRDLPEIQRKWPVLLLLAAAGVGTWAAFLRYAANQERLSSSVTQQIMKNLRDSPEVQEVLGDAIRPEPVWYLNGDPWVDGVINMLQGNIDLKFRVKGHKGAGTLHFTSIRRAKGEPFTILRFKIIADDGTVINVASNPT